jgi:predicted nucleic acid-binding protein
MGEREAQVVDACVFVDHLLGGRPLIGDGIELHAPAAVDLEVMSAWRRMMLNGSATASTVREGIELYSAMPIRRHEHLLLLPRIWQLRHDVAVFDAAYVALAEALGLPLLTADRRLARTARRYCDVIEV